MLFINKTKIASLFLGSALVLSSCEAVQNSNNQQRGTGIGVASGAVLGGVLGNNLGRGGHTAEGAVIGSIIGGIAGNIIGRKMDKQAKEIQETLPGAQVERVGEGIKVTMNESIVNFDFDSSNLGTKAKENLNKLATVLNNNPDTHIDIFGYTDSVGKADYNVKLSERRANAVKSYLISKGIGAKRMTSKGLGATNPVADNSSSSGRAQNRRVEFAITANEQMVNEAKSQNN